MSAAPPINKLDTLLALAEGSCGAHTWRHLYLRREPADEDILRGGDLSCAYFISSLLLIMQLIKEPHATVQGCLRDMTTSGWHQISKPQPGAVLVWEPKGNGQESHSHIGLYVGDKRAVSNSSWRRYPVRHHWTYHGRRQLISIWQHPELTPPH